MVWKKTEAEPPRVTPSPSPPPPRVEPRREVATIGPSISIKGDLSGEEDLRIQGRVEGEITLKQNNVTIGHEGKIRADIHGRSICVEGLVDGNLYGAEEVIIRQSGTVRGNIVAPRVTLENGSQFKGSIDMEPAASTSTHVDDGAKAKAGSRRKPRKRGRAEAPAAEAPSAPAVSPNAPQPGLQLDEPAART